MQSFNKIAKPLILMLKISSSKNLLSLMNMVKNNKDIIDSSGDCEDETVQKSLLTSENSNEASYLTPGAK